MFCFQDIIIKIKKRTKTGMKMMERKEKRKNKHHAV